MISSFVKPAKVHYKPGQFILVKIQDEPIMFRAYSISSYGVDGTVVSVAVKRAKNGYGTDILFSEFKVGDQVTLEGPMGDELVVDKNATKILLVGGGIGITPFVPITRDLLLDETSTRLVTLVYGVNATTDLVYSDIFDELALGHKNFNYVPVVAQDSSWQGQKGFVTDAIKAMDLRGYTVYMCGPKPMTNAASKLLKEKGVKDTDIFVDTA